MDPNTEIQTEAQAIAEVVLTSMRPQTVTVAERRFLLFGEGVQSNEITDPNQLNVDRGFVKAAVTLQTKDSLVTYVPRFGTKDTMLFADIGRSAITARIDYHEAVEGGTPAVPNYDAHQATLILPFSQEWKDWTGINGQFMSQKDFARWIEEHPGDIVAPDAGQLRDMTRDLAALRKVNFMEAVRTNSEAESFTYRQENEVHRDGQAIDIPTQFQLGIPVYFGEPTTTLMAYLRWNIDDAGKLTLGVKLSRAEYVRQAVFKQIVTEIAEATRTPAVYATA